MDLLFVEDEVQILENYRDFLLNYFENIYEAINVNDAYSLYKKHNPEVIISDIHLDDGNGLDFIKKVRQYDRQTKIIIMSAYKNEEYLFEAIELNLLKYLVKPVKGKIIKSLIEDISNDNMKSKAIKFKEGFMWCITRKRLFYKNEEISLTKNEIQLLETFCRNEKNYFSHDDIYYALYDDLEEYNSNKVRMIIKRLRQKTYKEFIVNIYGLGYTFNYM